MTSARDRWLCPVCTRPVGARDGLLSRHGVPECPGRGRLVFLLPAHEPRPARSEPSGPELQPPSWIPAPQPVDLAPFRRWRALGWTEHQIAAVTGEGALW